MGLHETASAERVHIAFFGVRNAGKSSLVNAVTGQDLAVVSDVKGTTTDPVKKAMELLPLGPVVIIDTPGIDDEGALGEKRVKKAADVLSQTDVAVLVVESGREKNADEEAWANTLRNKNIPYLVARTKVDLLKDVPADTAQEIYVSAASGYGINALKEALGHMAKDRGPEKMILGDLVEAGDTVVLVVPIDESAPKGRLILPQQQTLRELLDFHCSAVFCQPEELTGVLAKLSAPPRLVVTDSQVFERVEKNVPKSVPLTSFSILFARYKGMLPELVRGAAQLSKLKGGDTVLIAEGCTHHRQCNDIGTVKMPKWIEAFTGVKPVYRFCSGGDFPNDLSGVALVVHCGGCMLNEKEMHSRIERCTESGVPIVNYGVAIARMHGILNRSLEVFPEIRQIAEQTE